MSNDFWRNRIVESGAASPGELAKGMNPLNWRGHPESQREALEEALDSIGFLQRVLVNRSSGRVIDGHLRIELAVLKQQPLIPVDYVELTDDEEALALATLDAITEQAQPIADKLAALMERTKHLTADKPGLAAMLEQLKVRAGVNGNGNGNGQEPGIPTETEAERLAKEYGCKLGQVWQLGRHKIACVDSTNEATVKELIGGNRVGMVWADPPYGIKAASSYADGTVHKGMYSARGKFTDIIGDDNSQTAKKAVQLFLDIVPNAIHIWWGANNYTDVLPTSTCWIVWDKENPGVEFADAELAWSNQKLAVRIFKHQWMGVWKDSEKGQRRIHPTQKPIALSEWCFEKYGESDNLIFDPFLGSGISVLAAEKLNDGRRVIGCELAPEYIAVTIHRWQQMTQQQPRLISG